MLAEPFCSEVEEKQERETYQRQVDCAPDRRLFSAQETHPDIFNEDSPSKSMKENLLPRPVEALPPIGLQYQASFQNFSRHEWNQTPVQWR
jgi:hypothetical protein